MEFVAPIVDSVVTFLTVTITKHVGFFVSSTKNVKAMDAKMKLLNAAEKDMKEKKERADAHDKVVSELVSPWLEDVKKLNEEVENIQQVRIGCFTVAKRYKAGKQSFDILEKIKELEERSKIEWTDEPKPLGLVGSATCTLPSSYAALSHDATNNGFESRKMIFKDALEFLGSKDENKKMMALCGMGGVGKTTMMEQLRKVVEDSRMFDWVVKVVIGENTDLIAIQQAIVEKMGGTLTETTKNARAERLSKRFAGMSQDGKKKILVIMDDLWNEVDLKDVGLLSPIPNGIKLLFTSRFESVCSQMGVDADSIFRVGVLNVEEAKTLFFRNVGPSIDDPELQKIGEDIVKECRGLPIAIVTIAKNLKDNIKEAWEAVRSRLQDDDLEDLDSIVNTIFKMSYDNLKKDVEKAIFLLSGLFPDDFDIPTEDLLRYGWGLGFFKNLKILATARRDMKNLIRANLLIESDRVECVKMHDLVRAFALSNFSKVKQASIVDHESMSLRVTEDANESYERILLNCKGMSELPTNINSPNLSLLLLIGGESGSYHHLKFHLDFYERLYNPLLPVKFENATKLRTLCLRSCVLMHDLSFLGSLVNLETLSFANCSVTKLPSAIGKLKKLKLLDLTRCVSLCIDNGVFENLVSLEELYMRASKGSPIKFTYANCIELGKLSIGLHALEMEFFENAAQPKNMSFKKLERFRISIGCQLDNDYNFFIEEISFKNTLNLVSNSNDLSECNISLLFDRTEELCLQVNDMNNIEDVSMGQSFYNLSVLEVNDCEELTYLFSIPVAKGLKKLTHLTVCNCRVLKALIGGENCGGGVIKFPELNFISLERLPKLVSMSETNVSVIELLKVTELGLSDLPNFTSIFPEISSNTPSVQSILSKEVVIPNLEIINICNMEKLKHIWPCQMTSIAEENNVSMVREVEVEGCDSLVNLFPSNPLPLLNHLEEVEVRECGSIEVLFNLDLEHVGEMEVRDISSRLRKIKVERSGKLRELWRIKGVDINSDTLINGFKAVESIRIEGCNEFKFIFTPTTINFDLGALAEFYNSINESQESSDMLEDESNVISEEEMDDKIPNFINTCQLLNTSPHLQTIELRGDKRVEVVFEMELSRNQQPPMLLPYLQDLVLRNMENMSDVWKWNKFFNIHHHPSLFPFHNLSEITLHKCPKINYLLSPLMAKFLSNLKSVSIEYCQSIEQVISSRDDDDDEIATSTFTSSHSVLTSLFPLLETLDLGGLECLKRIDGVDMSGSSDQISFNTTTSTSIHHQFQSPRLKGITVVPQQSNLKKLDIYECDVLLHVFSFSTLESLKNLNELKVRSCKETQVIVKEEDGDQKVVVFPCLKTLVLVHLPNLKGFFLGKNHEFRWPLLDVVIIDDCPNMTSFTSGHSETPKLGYIRTELGKHTLECGLNFHHQTTFDPTNSEGEGTPDWSYHNLIEITKSFWSCKEDKKIILSNVLLQLQKLEKIHLNYVYRVEEVFEVVEEEKTVNDSDSKTVVKIPNLREVYLECVFDLKYLWKSNQRMVLEFPNLTNVLIDRCDSLEHVFTCSMIGSLMQLKDLSIIYCQNITVVVKEEEEVVNDIIKLPRLKSLRLKKLASLQGFCLGKEAFSFPSLDTLKIHNCPEMKIFTKGHTVTPELKLIDINYGILDASEQDLNSFKKANLEEEAGL